MRKIFCSLFTFILIVFASSSLPAFGRQGGDGDSGIVIGNGGQSVVCYDNDGRPASGESLDLFEGRALNNYKYDQYLGRDPIELAIYLARKIDASQGGSDGFNSNVEAKTRYVISNLIFLPAGVGLKDTNDGGEFVVPKNCTVVQTINFRSNRKIYVDSDTWASLDPLNRAALYLHEAVYWHLREGGLERDSRRTRKIISYLFGGGDLLPRAALLAEDWTSIQYCHSKVFLPRQRDYNTKLFVYRLGGDQLVIQLLQLGGYKLIERTALYVKNEEIRGASSGGSPFIPEVNEERSLSGWIKASTNDEMHLELSWGGGEVFLEATVLEGLKVSDNLKCYDWNFAPDGGR
jgi:hypothetical protein